MESFLFLLSIILLAGVWAARVGDRLGLPVLIGFVAIGVVLGPGGLAITPPVSPSLAKSLGYMALILILFEGGLHTSRKRLMKALLPAFSLATFGVLISAFIMAVLAHYLLHLSMFPAALLGVAVSSTDAASVFAMLGGQALRKQLVDVLEAESGTNDPMAFFLTLILLQWFAHGIGAPWHAVGYVVGTFTLQMVVGFVVGIGVGYLASVLNQRIKLDTGGLYPTLSLSFALLSYVLAVFFDGSGFLSVYVASVVMGNRKLDHRHSILRFHEGLAWTMHILMFVVLGFQLDLTQLHRIWLPGIGLAVGALFVARPVAVFLSTVKMGFDWKEKLFLSWAGLRGAVPIVLVLSAVVPPENMPNILLNAVFFVVIASTLVQSFTVKPFAKKLNLLDPSPSEGLLELVAIARENAIVLPVEISEDSRLLHRKMVDVPFPSNTLCYALVRDNQVIVPRGATRLKSSDNLLILSDRRHVEDLQRLFAEEIVGESMFLP
ncbi:potassium/proton antiporter [Alicyclobacillus sp. SO9]|uniref:potassium/proton antiporter n=1 Tax=Alicyclobacillus sp. SO9 TaxID=2665646 RepID=UPI0018E6F9AB|nr:potassium/proton antiporter [Alicyclobacillus sp. SO9]QQE80666.1 potassium/proton antiporter [Alicyclobacillus sp. SO9]